MATDKIRMEKIEMLLRKPQFVFSPLPSEHRSGSAGMLPLCLPGCPSSVPVHGTTPAVASIPPSAPCFPDVT